MHLRKTELNWFWLFYDLQLKNLILTLEIFLNLWCYFLFKYHVWNVCIHFSFLNKYRFFSLQISYWTKGWIFLSFFCIAVNHIYYFCLFQTHFAIKDFKIFSPSSWGKTKGETNKENDFIQSFHFWSWFLPAMNFIPELSFTVLQRWKKLLYPIKSKFIFGVNVGEVWRMI